MSEDKRNGWSKAEIIAKILGAVVIPIVIVAVGHLFIAQRERADQARREVEQITRISTQLSSENTKERRLALGLLKYYKQANKFPNELAPALRNMIINDGLEIAVDALVLVGASEELISREERVLLELLAPMVVHLERTEQAFRQWNSCQETEIIHQGNSFIRNLLLNKKDLIPPGLQADAQKLIKHYDAWLEEYERRKKGNLDLCEPIYVGPIGFPFPAQSALRFIKEFEALRAEFWNP